MPNVASALKAEISRLARKELKSEITALRSAAARHRSEIAGLKRRLEALQRELSSVARTASRSATASQEEEPAGSSTRFSAKGLASQRKRLGLSAEALGKLVGVSALSIYKWESGNARPRARYMPAIAALRTLKKKVAAQVIAER